MTKKNQMPIKISDYDALYIQVKLCKGLEAGGYKSASGPIKKGKNDRKRYWWLDRISNKGISAICGFQIYAYKPGVFRLNTSPLQNYVPKRIYECFDGGNALEAKGVGELSFAYEEIKAGEFIFQLGYCFARLIRGELVIPDRFQGVSESNFPGYAWTAKGYELNRPTKSGEAASTRPSCVANAVVEELP